VNTFLKLEITGSAVRLLIAASFSKGVSVGIGVGVGAGVGVSIPNIRLGLAFK